MVNTIIKTKALHICESCQEEIEIGSTAQYLHGKEPRYRKFCGEIIGVGVIYNEVYLCENCLRKGYKG